MFATFLIGRHKLVTIVIQEGAENGQGRPLVGVNESMVSHDPEGIGGGQFADIGRGVIRQDWERVSVLLPPSSGGKNPHHPRAEAA